MGDTESGGPGGLIRAGAGMVAVLVAAATVGHTMDVGPTRAAKEAVGWMLVVGLTAAYLAGWRALARGGQGSRAVWAFTCVAGVAAAAVPPLRSTDVYCYVNRGWQDVRYGRNPFVHVVADIPDWDRDPMFRPHWVASPSPYGALFERAAATLCRLGHGNWVTTVGLFKAASLAVYLLTAWVVWRWAGAFPGVDPARALVLFAWNPSILSSSLIDAHNDLWMGGLTALGVGLAAAGGRLVATPVLTAAALVKFATLAVVPFTTLALARRRGWPPACAGLALGGLLAWGVVRGYIPDDPTELVRARLGEPVAVHNSVAAMVLYPLELSGRWVPWVRRHWEDLERAVTTAFLGGFVAFYAALAWRRVRGTGYDRATYVRDCVLISFVLVCVASAKYYPWYLGMFFPLALWLPEGDRLRRVVLAVSVAHCLALTFVAQTHFLNTLLMIVAPTVWALRTGQPAKPGAVTCPP